jgi:hypothetical protein
MAGRRRHGAIESTKAGKMWTTVAEGKVLFLSDFR